ncbi:hypothetical protein [Nocardiopsis composta]|uniref:Uncharacterized protein n=1 Tax=Nocardiopsis composta TaxID=157465 RepID=A0A7W8VBJ0_9ACTN|nr:hypothetical protein [Nocardiopsis composta]MBB5429939.1 hypothetical protein [Nocardiopsis composta]
MLLFRMYALLTNPDGNPITSEQAMRTGPALVEASERAARILTDPDTGMWAALAAVEISDAGARLEFAVRAPEHPGGMARLRTAVDGVADGAGLATAALLYQPAAPDDPLHDIDF